jgi:hypothetical protein
MQRTQRSAAPRTVFAVQGDSGLAGGCVQVEQDLGDALGAEHRHDVLHSRHSRAGSRHSRRRRVRRSLTGRLATHCKPVASDSQPHTLPRPLRTLHLPTFISRPACTTVQSSTS